MNDVKVKIDLTKPIGNLGIGVPLILSCKSTTDNSEMVPDVGGSSDSGEITECYSAEDVKNLGFAITTDVYKAADLMFKQKNPPKKIAVCRTEKTAAEWLAEKANLLKDWRQLVCIYSNTDVVDNIKEIIPIMETTDKIFFVGLPVDSTFKASTITEVKEIRRTVLFYCTDNSSAHYKNPEAAFVGATAGLAAGSFTYKNAILTGITPQELTDGEISTIHANGGITFVAKAGDNVTSEGKTAGGEYIDIIDSEDFVIQQLTYRTQKLLNKSNKIPYDNNGIAMLESVAVDVLQTAYNNGIIADDADGKPDFTVNYLLREDTKAIDRAERRYIGGSFTFALAGAVHTVEITGEITI